MWKHKGKQREYEIHVGTIVDLHNSPSISWYDEGAFYPNWLKYPEMSQWGKIWRTKTTYQQALSGFSMLHSLSNSHP